MQNRSLACRARFGRALDGAGGHQRHRDQRGHKRGAVDEQRNAGPAERDQDAAYGRADDPDEDGLEHLVDGGRTRQELGGYQGRSQGLRCGEEEGLAASVYEDEDEDHPQRLDVQLDEDAEGADGERADQAGRHHQDAPVHPVADHPADQQKSDLGQRERHPDRAQGCRGVGEVVDLPRDGHEIHPVAEE